MPSSIVSDDIYGTINLNLPWLTLKSILDLSLIELPKSLMNSTTYSQKFNLLFPISKYPDFKHIYTDNSTFLDPTGRSFFHKNNEILSFPSHFSIFSATFYAIKLYCTFTTFSQRYFNSVSYFSALLTI